MTSRESNAKSDGRTAPGMAQPWDVFSRAPWPSSMFDLDGLRAASTNAQENIGRRWSDMVSGVRSVSVAFREAVIDRTTLKKLQATIGQLRLAFPGMPKEVSTDETITRPCIFEGAYNGEMRAVVIRNIPESLLKPLARALQTSIEAQHLPLQVFDGGSAICINVNNAYKGRALTAFAKSIGVPEEEVLRFGDKPGPGGNDETMVTGPNGFNVGDKPAEDPTVKKTRLPNALGTAAVLRSKTPAEVKAIATDYDHTLTGDSHDFHPEALEQIVRYLNAGTKVAIITGRGPSIFGFVLPKLREGGITQDGLGNLVFALFNGSLFVTSEEAQQALDLETRAAKTANATNLTNATKVSAPRASAGEAEGAAPKTVTESAAGDGRPGRTDHRAATPSRRTKTSTLPTGGKKPSTTSWSPPWLFGRTPSPSPKVVVAAPSRVDVQHEPCAA